MEDDDHWQTRKSPIPVPPIPDWAGKRGGSPRFPTPPESGIGESPVSRFGRDRESRSRDRESRSRGRHAGDFLVWLAPIAPSGHARCWCRVLFKLNKPKGAFCKVRRFALVVRVDVRALKNGTTDGCTIKNSRDLTKEI